PAFAIGRVEEVLYWLKRLEDEKRIPSMPVYVDSPMAVGALQFYAARLNELDADMSVAGSRSDRGQPTIGSPAGRDPTPSGDGEPTPNAPRPDGVRKVTAFATARLTMVASPQQSADLIASRQPSIVVSSSGMATGGRVLRHLAATITNPKNTVMFVGYQA